MGPEALTSLLSHKDRWVRTAAIARMARLRFDDPTLIQLVLDGVDKFGLKANDDALRVARELPIDDRAFLRLVQHLPKATGRWGQALRILICKTPDALLMPKLDELMALDVWTDRERDRLENRRQISECPSNEAWDELVDLAEIGAESDVRGDDLAEDLVTSLASRKDVTNDDLCKVIRDKDAAPLLQAWTLRILGMRGKAAVAARDEVFALVSSCDPEVGLEAAYALGRLGDASVCERVPGLPIDDHEDPYFALTLAAVLEGFDDPRAVKAFHELLNRKYGEVDCEAEVALAACSTFDKTLVERVVEIARKLDPDATTVFLAGEVLPYAEALGMSLNERGKWTKIRKDEDEALAREEERSWVENADEDVDEDAEDAEAFEDDAAAEDDDDELEAIPPDTLLAHDPIVREGPKVGRNDSCPCGSGKKYKKCCGAAS